MFRSDGALLRKTSALLRKTGALFNVLAGRLNNAPVFFSFRAGLVRGFGGLVGNFRGN
jgi:hypothetical protein